jgi:hypothetical protein
MTERDEPTGHARAALCSWCDLPLTRDERERWWGRRHVCEACYLKLLAAGLRDEEIFREPPRVEG